MAQSVARDLAFVKSKVISRLLESDEFAKVMLRKEDFTDDEKNDMEYKQIFDDITNEEIATTIFCYNCGERHDGKKCPKSSTNQKSNLMTRANYHIKNPLKFQPIYRKEFNINHHIEFKNYYDDDNSSGESFTEIVEEHRHKYKIK